MGALVNAVDCGKSSLLVVSPVTEVTVASGAVSVKVLESKVRIGGLPGHRVHGGANAVAVIVSP